MSRRFRVPSCLVCIRCLCRPVFVRLLPLVSSVQDPDRPSLADVSAGLLLLLSSILSANLLTRVGLQARSPFPAKLDLVHRSHESCRPVRRASNSRSVEVEVEPRRSSSEFLAFFFQTALTDVLASGSGFTLGVAMALSWIESR